MTRNLFLAALTCGLCFTAAAQDGPRGHWEGSLETPNRTIEMKIDIDKTDKGWMGSMVNPQNNAPVPLSGVAFADGKLSFRLMGGGENAPLFTGALSADGKSLDGEIVAGPNAMPLKLKKTGEAKVDVPKPSPAVAKEFIGKWAGALDVNGNALRIEITIKNGDGGAMASLTSLDQGGGDIPANSIEAKDGKLSLKVNAIGGGYEGQLNKDGTEMTGEWSQNGNALPLNLKKK